MKKKIIAIVAVFAVIALMFVAYSCGKSNLEPEAPVTISASAAQQSALEFELICEQHISRTNVIWFWREKSTDTMYIEKYKKEPDGAGTGLIQMMDPETGKPLTYSRWLYSYQ